MTDGEHALRAIGSVESPLGDRAAAPDRPNPVGLHRVKILEIDDTRLRVAVRT